jgi:hypothetical protein
MSFLRVLCLLLIVPGVVFAQSSPEKMDSSPNNPDVATELKTLREALAQMQAQVTAQQREIETLKAEANAGSLATSNRIARNFFPDTPNTAKPRTVIGYGGPGSPNTNNRAIQQATFDWLQTFWKDTRYGALQSYIQYSYLTRAPWFVATHAPKNARLNMVYFGVRYVLPSTSGTLLRVPYPN